MYHKSCPMVDCKYWHNNICYAPRAYLKNKYSMEISGIGERSDLQRRCPNYIKVARILKPKEK